MTFLSALILGLLAGAHCAGMCGGLQMAMQAGSPQEVTLRSRREALSHLILMNVGRITTYVLAGAVFAYIGYATLNGLNITNSARWLRVATGVVIFLIGLQLFLGKQRPFQFIEPLGAAVWRAVSKLITHSSNRKTQSLVTGIAWGFLPCGLVYSVLFVSVLSNDVWASALTMLGFGLGTMPALLFTGLLYKRFKESVNSRSFQSAGGVFFMLGGSLILSAPYWVSLDFMHGYPELLNLAFCIA
jgi:sulfite exporter TauE/SafE